MAQTNPDKIKWRYHHSENCSNQSHTWVARTRKFTIASGNSCTTSVNTLFSTKFHITRSQCWKNGFFNSLRALLDLLWAPFGLITGPQMINDVRKKGLQLKKVQEKIDDLEVLQPFSYGSDFWAKRKLIYNFEMDGLRHDP